MVMAMVNVPVMVPEERLSDFYAMYAAWLSGSASANPEAQRSPSEAAGQADLPPWTAEDGDLARQVWSKLSQPAKRLFSTLIDSPGEHLSGDDLAERAEIPNGRQGVAGALSWPGRHCVAVGREGFWWWDSTV